jgi:hypothetical protein
MKTDDLIDMLSTNVEPADTRHTDHTIRRGLLIAAAAAIVAVLMSLGLRHDAMSVDKLVSLALKVVVMLAIVLVASRYLIRLAHPGGERRTAVGWVLWPIVGIMVLAAGTLAAAPRTHWHGLLLGDQWIECLISIPVIAVVPFAVIVWAVRQTAPTDLRRAGAMAGLVAGCLSAAGYALHCTDDSVPFVALWYGGTIALCTFLGWSFGPRLLRW